MKEIYRVLKDEECDIYFFIINNFEYNIFIEN